MQKKVRIVERTKVDLQKLGMIRSLNSSVVRLALSTLTVCTYTHDGVSSVRLTMLLPPNSPQSAANSCQHNSITLFVYDPLIPGRGVLCLCSDFITAIRIHFI